MLVINACNRPSRKVILLQGFPKNISDLPSDEREVGIIENIDFKYRTLLWETLYLAGNQSETKSKTRVM